MNTNNTNNFNNEATQNTTNTKHNYDTSVFAENPTKKFSKQKTSGTARIIMLAATFAAFVCFMMWRTGDLSPAPYLLLGEGGAMSVWLGSYAWKEKAANRYKYAMEFVREFDDKHGTATALQFAEIVLRD